MPVIWCEWHMPPTRGRDSEFPGARVMVRVERRSRGYRAIRLETGIRQPEAQRLYESLGYRRIAAFGPYVGNPTSVCYERILRGA